MKTNEIAILDFGFGLEDELNHLLVFETTNSNTNNNHYEGCSCKCSCKTKTSTSNS